MTAEHFDNVLQAYQRRRPFQGFRIRFVSGDHIDVDHPESVVIRAGVGVYISPQGIPTLFGHESVSKVQSDSERI